MVDPISLICTVAYEGDLISTVSCEITPSLMIAFFWLGVIIFLLAVIAFTLILK